jgi:chromosome segregation ATPase
VKSDPKSAKLVALEQQLSLALGLSLKYLQREHEDIYAQLYDAEAEVEALEIEQTRLQKLLEHKKERLELVQETNALLMTRLDAEKMRATTEVQWTAKLEEEARLRKQLEETLLRLQNEVLAVTTDY